MSTNPAIGVEIVGDIPLWYKDPEETRILEFNFTSMLVFSTDPAEDETITPGTVTIAILPDNGELTIDKNVSDKTITLSISKGGILHQTYELTVKFVSSLNEEYVDYSRLNIKRVYKYVS